MPLGIQFAKSFSFTSLASISPRYTRVEVETFHLVLEMKFVAPKTPLCMKYESRKSVFFLYIYPRCVICWKPSASITQPINSFQCCLAGNSRSSAHLTNCLIRRSPKRSPNYSGNLSFHCWAGRAGTVHQFISQMSLCPVRD